MNFTVKNINDMTFVNKETFTEILQENFKLKNELEHLKREKSFKEFKDEMSEHIKTINDKLNKLEYKLDNEIEINDESLSLEETKRIIQNELVRTKNEIITSNIIYRFHDCDSYEDLFRDNVPQLETKCDGIQISLDNMNNTDGENKGDDSGDDTSNCL
jgi:ribosome-binding ATPase YchF (GTP1/OBG family)